MLCVFVMCSKLPPAERAALSLHWACTLKTASSFATKLSTGKLVTDGQPVSIAMKPVQRGAC